MQTNHEQTNHEQTNMFKHMQTKHEQTNMFINICNKSWANKYVQTYANKNMSKQICSNQTCVNKPKNFLCSNMCTFKPLAWRSTHKISKNRPGGGRTIRGSETRGRSRPTNLSSAQQTPPPPPSPPLPLTFGKSNLGGVASSFVWCGNRTCSLVQHLLNIRGVKYIWHQTL